MMNKLSEWLHYLETRHSASIQLGLERIRIVAAALDLVSHNAVIITVAGTNGKGSTVAALDAIYHAAGYRVARYTSPHLIAFNERICMNQKSVSDEMICDALSHIHANPDSLSLTYFEMTTLAALWIFKQEKPDVIILEVGMGGRLDATNLLDADLSIITTIDLDHQAWLGSTREAIGYEKAGILRAHKPAIYADDNPPDSIMEYAAQHQVPMVYFNQDYFIEQHDMEFVLALKTGQSFNLPSPLIHLNAAAAALFATIQLQEKLPVSFKHWTYAMQHVMIAGRRQCIDGVVKHVFDVAHNPQAVRLLAAFFKEKKGQGRVHAVFSGLKDKDLSGLITPMREHVDFWYPTLLTGLRAADDVMLQEAFTHAQIKWGQCFSHPIQAYHAALNDAQPDDWIVVYGSFLTVGAILASQQTIGGYDEADKNGHG